MNKHRLSASELLPIVAATLDPVEPSPNVRDRLLAALEGPSRYLPFRPELAAHFDLSEERMQALLDCIDQPPRWKSGTPPLEGYLNFAPGPRLAPLHGGFLRLQGGAGFPLHRHGDRELTFVLSGHLEDDAGRRFGPGEVVDMPRASTHAIRVVHGAPAVLAVLSGGIELLGT